MFFYEDNGKRVRLDRGVYDHIIDEAGSTVLHYGN
jgi:hypothetical protein